MLIVMTIGIMIYTTANLDDFVEEFVPQIKENKSFLVPRITSSQSEHLHVFRTA